jgi:hypothetical protein
VLKGLTYTTISELSGISVSTLENDFHKRLESKPPPQMITPQYKNEMDRPIYLLIDGKWRGKTSVDMFYRHEQTLKPSFITRFSSVSMLHKYKKTYTTLWTN